MASTLLARLGFSRLELQRARDQQSGEALHFDVVRIDGAGVVVARERDLVLRVREVVLQLQICLVRFEIRIRLDDRR